MDGQELGGKGDEAGQVPEIDKQAETLRLEADPRGPDPGDEANLNLSEYCEEMVSYLVKNRKNEAVSFGLHLELAVRLARQYPECQEQLIAQLEKSADLDNRLLLGELTIILELPAKHLHGVMDKLSVKCVPSRNTQVERPLPVLQLVH
jgi:hypothetical protein